MTNVAILRLPQHMTSYWQGTSTFMLSNIEKRCEIVFSRCGLHAHDQSWGGFVAPVKNDATKRWSISLARLEGRNIAWQEKEHKRK
jgi:hypothetical protein